MNKKAKARLDPVEVFSRIRPLQDNENEKCLRALDDCSLLLQIPESSATYRSGQTKQLVYSFTQIFDEHASQQDIYDNVGYPLVSDLLLGKNGLLFTYGVTSSGKTHTMLGNPNDPGLLQRCLDTIFSSISFQQANKYTFKPDKQNGFEIQTEAAALLERQKRDILQTKGSQAHRNKALADAEKLNDKNGRLVNVNDEHVFAVFISCIEIYNNYIYDLLDDLNSDSSSKRNGLISDAKESKSLKEDSKGSMYIKDSVEVEVKSTEEALELMHRAQKKRVVASTDLNAESSRSHSIFTIRVVQTSYDSSSIDDYTNKARASVHVSQLSLVDLAGSERTKRTKNTGSRLKEAGNINSSLMALRNCMEALRENVTSSTKKIVPYRDSKLTLLFKNYFEGHGRIKMILCINPSVQEFDETINVLKFSELVKDVLVQAANEIKFQKTHEIENANIFLNNLFNNYHLIECFPALDVRSPDDNVTIPNLTGFLEELYNRNCSHQNDLNTLYQQFGSKVREVFAENEHLKTEMAELRQRLEVKERNELKLDQKIKALERVINGTRTPAKENIRPIISDNDLTEKRRNRELDMPPLPLSSGHTPLATHRSNRVVPNTTGRSTATTTTSQQQQSLAQTPSSCKLFSINNPYSAHLQAQQQQHHRYQSPGRGTPPTPREGLAIANRRAQRRSKSADIWLDHKPPTVAKIDTVFQPKMSRKISVSKVELSDAKKSSKYLLTTQQQDNDGEIITNLIRGDIIKSPSGGANVLFTDIETLSVRNQEHARPRKRKSSELILNDPQITEERCAIGIEGHSKSARKYSAIK